MSKKETMLPDLKETSLQNMGNQLSTSFSYSPYKLKALIRFKVTSNHEKESNGQPILQIKRIDCNLNQIKQSRNLEKLRTYFVNIQNSNSKDRDNIGIRQSSYESENFKERDQSITFREDTGNDEYLALKIENSNNQINSLTAKEMLNNSLFKGYTQDHKSQWLPPLNASRMPIYKKDFIRRALKLLSKQVNQTQINDDNNDDYAEAEQILAQGLTIRKQTRNQIQTSKIDSNDQEIPKQKHKRQYIHHKKNEVSRSSSTPFMNKSQKEQSQINKRKDVEVSKPQKTRPQLRTNNQETPEKNQNFIKRSIPINKQEPKFEQSYLFKIKTREKRSSLQKQDDGNKSRSVEKEVEKKESIQNQVPAYQTFKKKKILKEQPQMIDERIIKRNKDFMYFLTLINFTNQLQLPTIRSSSCPLYSIYIGKGNNHNLIVNAFKNRWWWQESESIDNVNMVWTQLRVNKFITQLKVCQTMSNFNMDVSNNEKIIDGTFIVNNYSSLHNAQQIGLRRLLSSKEYLPHLSDHDQLQRVSKRLRKNHDDPQNRKIHNHLENNWNLGNKKALFYNMRKYYTAIGNDYRDFMPVTYHIQNGTDDAQYVQLRDYAKYNQLLDQGIWIVKPGEITNRGQGITVCQGLVQVDEVFALNEKHSDGKPVTYIVQKYIDKPFLYFRRKFDLRCYTLVTSVEGILKAYWYTDGYIRTASREFTLKNFNKFIHLTNDAIQKNSEEYGKFEEGNKISYSDFQRYLNDQYFDKKFSFSNDAYPKMKQIAIDIVRATYCKIDPQRLSYSFEIFGLDFMIDENFKVLLIEVNTNPCLELSCPLLSRIIPTMVENALRIAVDPLFPPPPLSEWPLNKRQYQPSNPLEFNKFELIFDENPIQQKNCSTQEQAILISDKE